MHALRSKEEHEISPFGNEFGGEHRHSNSLMQPTEIGVRTHHATRAATRLLRRAPGFTNDESVPEHRESAFKYRVTRLQYRDIKLLYLLTKGLYRDTELQFPDSGRGN